MICQSLTKSDTLKKGKQKREGKKEGGRKERKWERGRRKEMKKERREREKGGNPRIHPYVSPSPFISFNVISPLTVTTFFFFLFIQIKTWHVFEVLTASKTCSH